MIGSLTPIPGGKGAPVDRVYACRHFCRGVYRPI